MYLYYGVGFPRFPRTASAFRAPAADRGRARHARGAAHSARGPRGANGQRAQRDLRAGRQEPTGTRASGALPAHLEGLHLSYTSCRFEIRKVRDNAKDPDTLCGEFSPRDHRVRRWHAQGRKFDVFPIIFELFSNAFSLKINDFSMDFPMLFPMKINGISL